MFPRSFFIVGGLLLMLGGGLHALREQELMRQEALADECSLFASWTAERPYTNYFELVTFDDELSGRMTIIDNQASWPIDFRYHVAAPGKMDLEYLEDWIDERQRALHFWIEIGSFAVIEPPGYGNPEPVEQHYRCRLRFDANPFPATTGRGNVAFYSHRLD